MTIQEQLDKEKNMKKFIKILIAQLTAYAIKEAVKLGKRLAKWWRERRVK